MAGEEGVVADESTVPLLEEDRLVRAEAPYGSFRSVKSVHHQTHCATYRDWSDPWWLLAYAAAEAGQLLLTLASIAWMVLKQDRFCMACGGHDHEIYVAWMCEYSKCFLRLFPLMAVLITLVVASRTLLQRHLFYQMLEHGVVVNLKSLRPSEDPLFYFLVFCLMHVLFHFMLAVQIPVTKLPGIIVTTYSQGQAGKSAETAAYFESMKLFAFYYLGPAVVFLVFLWGSYDTETTLLPLSKFVEGSPRTACDILSGAEFLSVAAVKEAVDSGLSFQGEDGEGSCEVRDVCWEVVQKAQQRCQQPRAEEIERLPVGPCRCGRMRKRAVGYCRRCGVRKEKNFLDVGRSGTAMKQVMTVGSTTPLTDTAWIAELLLDNRLTDETSRSFRKVWFIYSLIALIVMLGVTVAFVSATRESLHQAMVEHKRRYVPTIPVYILHLSVALRVAYRLASESWIPFRSRPPCEKRARAY